MSEFWYEYIFVSEDTIFVTELNNKRVLELNDDEKNRAEAFYAKQQIEEQRFLGNLMNETRV